MDKKNRFFVFENLKIKHKIFSDKKASTSIAIVILVILTISLISYSLINFMAKKSNVSNDLNVVNDLQEIYAQENLLKFYFSKKTSFYRDELTTIVQELVIENSGMKIIKKTKDIEINYSLKEVKNFKLKERPMEVSLYPDLRTGIKFFVRDAQGDLEIEYFFKGNDWVQNYKEKANEESTKNHFSLLKGMGYSNGIKELLNQVSSSYEKINKNLYFYIYDKNVAEEFKGLDQTDLEENAGENVYLTTGDLVSMGSNKVYNKIINVLKTKNI